MYDLSQESNESPIPIPRLISRSSNICMYPNDFSLI